MAKSEEKKKNIFQARWENEINPFQVIKCSFSLQSEWTTNKSTNGTFFSI